VKKKRLRFTRRAFHLNFSAHHAHDAREMDIKPRPPNCRVTEVSDCWKASKILEWCFRWNPMAGYRGLEPYLRLLLHCASDTSLPQRHFPASVNFTAFPSRLIKLPQPGGIALQPFRQIAAHRPFQFQPFSWARRVTGCSAFSAQSSIEKGTCSTFVLPVSILGKNPVCLR